jgi:hypothetical protein
MILTTLTGTTPDGKIVGVIKKNSFKFLMSGVEYDIKTQSFPSAEGFIR